MGCQEFRLLLISSHAGDIREATRRHAPPSAVKSRLLVHAALPACAFTSMTHPMFHGNIAEVRQGTSLPPCYVQLAAVFYRTSRT